MTASQDEDEAMEWITEWEYERILPDHQQASKKEHSHIDHHPHDLHPQGDDAVEEAYHNHDDHHDDIHDDIHNHVDDEMMDVDVDDDPLPLDDDSENEICIFWARVQPPFATDDISDDEDDLSFTILPQEMQTEIHELADFSKPPPLSWEHKEDDHSVMDPLDDKDGLLPPLSPQQYNNHQGSTMMFQHPAAAGVGAAGEDSKNSSATTIIMDMQEEKSATLSCTTGALLLDSGDIFERQQQLLQEVLQSQRSRAHHPQLPTPSQHSQQLFREMRTSLQGREKPPPPTKPSASDPIFARQQQIFEELRAAKCASTASSTASTAPTTPPSTTSGSSSPSSFLADEATPPPPPVPSSEFAIAMKPNQVTSGSSPVSVTKTLTRAGMDQEDYNKVVTQLTEKNLMERQKKLLEQSMKRSWKTRQALHIKPTALENYDHDKLTQVLADVRTSTRNISNTYY
jgi:hypothetical protein